ncbi:MAG TPA: hypothetical protein ENK07_09825 [Bacteroidetes bacterium]|nr:hypothetical protein [Bacteroidota bacterium]
MLVSGQRKSSLRSRRAAKELRTEYGGPAERALRTVRTPRRKVRRRAETDWSSLRVWVLGFGFFLLFSILMIAQRVQVIRLGREIEQLQGRRRELVDEVRDLTVRYSQATKYDVIHRRAQSELGFADPPVRDLYVDP